MFWTALVVALAFPTDSRWPQGGAPFYSPIANPCLTQLSGRWMGAGDVAGRKITMEQQWAPAIAQAFSELRMAHFGSDGKVAFEGRGFYRARPQNDSVSGTWMDARGFTMGIRGHCRSGTLTNEWTGETEQGETHYAVRGDTLTVTDFVRRPDGSLQRFGLSRLVRMP